MRPMELIGDLERAFAAAIYPNRVLIGVVALIGLVGLAILARRRRWGDVARRHPRAAITALAVAVVIGAPLGWYLASPLVLSTTIDEPAPVVAVAESPTPPAPTSPPSEEPARPSPTATPSATPRPTSTPPPPRAGGFVGADEFHFTRGSATLLETPDGPVLRFEDFEVRNGPDLFVYLSPSADGYADGAIELARLKADRGNQNYAVPADVDLDAVRSVVIWCKAFAVEFGTAAL